MKYNYLLICSVLLLLFSQNLFAQEDESKIDPYLKNMLLDAKYENNTFNVYAVMKERLSLEYLESKTAGLAKKEKRSEVIRILKEFASGKQENYLSFLRSAESNGLVTDIAVNWAINVISFTAGAGVIYNSAENFNEIEKIYYDPVYPFEMLQDDNGITAINDKYNLRVESIAGNQPGLILINAPQVWALGDSGQGVLVANIDSGTDWRHPDLVNNIWNNLGEDANGNGTTVIWNGASWVFDPGDINGIDDDGNGLVDDFVGWNWTNNSNDVTISSSHGTATAGIVAGYGTMGTQTGVAPKAKLITLKPSGESQYWLAQQYAIDKGADIVTSSLSYKWYFSPKPNYALFRQMNDMELAAGVLHTNSTSNDGGSLGSAPIPFNISAPGNSPGPWVHPDQTLVGGLSSVIGSANVLASTDLIVSSSPYGPATWENIQQNNPSYPYVMPMNYRDYPYQTIPGSMGLIKPDLAAPGNGTVSTAPGTGYQSFSGTSGATPHLAGVAALLLSGNPDLTPAAISMIMQTTAVEKGAPGKDNRYGAGRVDALEAYLLATIPVELSAFNAEVSWNEVNLYWTTTTEINNYGFEVERKSHKNNWENISFVKGIGNSIEINQYSYSDQSVSPGKYSYRLRQVDYDGSFKYSDEIEIDIENPSDFILNQNYPNPFNPSTSIEFSLIEKSSVTLEVYSILGELITSLVNDNLDAGYHKVSFNSNELNSGRGLASGIYIYKLKAEGALKSFTSAKKMILTK
jgi:subtilisin family serine protease